MTTDQKARLADIVIDPDAWHDHVVNVFGQRKADEFLDAKINQPRHREALETRKSRPNYKTRAERDSIEQAALAAKE